MNLHYGGHFGEWGYLNGEVDHEEFDIDRTSVVRIDLGARGLGVFENVMYYWRDPLKDYNSGRKILESDAGAFEMALNGLDAGEIDVYVRHLSEDDLFEAMNPMGRGVVIEEIVEEKNENEVRSRLSGVNIVRSDRVNVSGVDRDVSIGKRQDF